MSEVFQQRVFGCAIIRSINSNYNADFTHQPRTLPDGTVYATDKALKYTVRNFLKHCYPEEKIFYFRTLNEDMQPRSLDETYEALFGSYPEEKGKDKDKALRKAVAKNLLDCLDVRLFGGTYAGKTNLSLHGPVQISHGMNRFVEGVIYSEQIMSPFRNPGERNTDSTMTTLGTQSKLREGHYVHHFSINPHNLQTLAELSEGQVLTEADIEKLKKALTTGATFYDSSAKAGTENELLLWIQLKPGSQLVLPSLVEKISIDQDRNIDLSAVTLLLERETVAPHVEKIEIHCETGLSIKGDPSNAEFVELYQ